MNKIKVILCTMSIFIISAVGCFADSVSSSKAYNLDSNNYYVSSTIIYSGLKVLYTFNDYDGSGVISGNVNYYRYKDGSYVFYRKESSVTFSSAMRYHASNNTSLFSYLNSNFEIDSDNSVLPPVIAPTVQKAITQIVPNFLEQLGNYLPTCILILSMLLGVSLVPRIIHLLM